MAAVAAVATFVAASNGRVEVRGFEEVGQQIGWRAGGGAGGGGVFMFLLASAARPLIPRPREDGRSMHCSHRTDQRWPNRSFLRHFAEGGWSGGVTH